MQRPEPPSPASSPDALAPAGARRATDDALAVARDACAALAARLAALPADADPAALRQALLALPAPLHDAGVALARLAAADPGACADPAGADPLTGLADAPRLAAACAALAARHPDTPLTLVAVDVDHLRHLNDTRSHATGDAVLQAVAGVLRAQSRPQDVLARAEPTRFVVALGGPVSTTRALLVAERLRAAIENHGWATLADGLQVTASLGVATWAPGEALDEALARAGLALQDCKRGGRNQVRARA